MRPVKIFQKTKGILLVRAYLGGHMVLGVATDYSLSSTNAQIQNPVGSSEKVASGFRLGGGFCNIYNWLVTT